MTAHIMYDDVSIDLIPPTATIIGVYIDGRFKNESEARSKFPNATLVTIAVSSADNAEILDVETGDATIADVYAWLNRQLERGVERPGVYTSVSNVDRLMLTMNANKFKRSQYRLWSAHFDAGEHICGPETCKLTQTACDWTQWTDTADNRSLDESTLGAERPLFAGAARAATATPSPADTILAPARLISGRLMQDLDVPVRSMRGDSLPSSLVMRRALRIVTRGPILPVIFPVVSRGHGPPVSGRSSVRTRNTVCAVMSTFRPGRRPRRGSGNAAAYPGKDSLR